MSLNQAATIAPRTAHEALEMIKAAAGALQSAGVFLEDNLHQLNVTEREELAAELEIMRVFMNNLEASSRFERHVAPGS